MVVVCAHGSWVSPCNPPPNSSDLLITKLRVDSKVQQLQTWPDFCWSFNTSGNDGLRLIILPIISKMKSQNYIPLLYDIHHFNAPEPTLIRECLMPSCETAGTLSSKLWPNTRNWAKSGGLALCQSGHSSYHLSLAATGLKIDRPVLLQAIQFWLTTPDPIHMLQEWGEGRVPAVLGETATSSSSDLPYTSSL